MGLIGLIIALINVNRANIMIENYNNNLGKYTESSYKKVISGRMCSYVSLGIMGALILVIMVAMISN